MSNDDLDFDPDDANSVIAWSRRQPVVPSRFEEPEAPVTLKRDPASAAWAEYIERLVAERVDQALDLVAEEAGRTERALREEIHSLINQIQELNRRIFQSEQKAKQVTIVAPALDMREALAPLHAEIERLRQLITNNNKSGAVVDLTRRQA
jgi:hypothetical protein